MKKRSKIFLAAGLLLISVIIIVATWKSTSPPEQIQTINIPVQETSFISMPISVSQFEIERAIRTAMKSPVYSGTSSEIDAKLLATEPISITRVIKTQVSPLIPGHYVDLIVSDWVDIKEIGDCWNPLNCAKIVKKRVDRVVRQWVEEQAAIYQYTSPVTTELIDKIYDVGAWIHYDIYVEDLKFSFIGNDVNVVIKTNTNLVFDYKQPIIPLGPTVKVKGAMNCNVENEIVLAGKVSINKDLGLDIELSDNDTKFDMSKACVPFAIQGLDVLSYMNPEWFATKKVLSRIIHDAAVGAINKKIEDNTALQFKDRLNELAKTANQPRLISQNLWAVPSIEEGFVSNLDTYNEGSESFLRINVGLKAKPKFILSSDMPIVDQKDIPMTLGKLGNEVNARLSVGVNYKSAGSLLTDTLNEFISKNLKKYPIKNCKIQFYASNRHLVLDLKVNLKKVNKQIDIYLWGVPRFDEKSNMVYVDSLDYYLNSKNVFAKFVNVAAAKSLKAYIQKKSQWSVNKQIETIKSKLDSINTNSPSLPLTGSLKLVKISNAFTDKDQITVFLDLKGKLSLEIHPQGYLVDNSSKKIVNTDVPMPDEFGSGPSSIEIPKKSRVYPSGFYVTADLIRAIGDSIFVMKNNLPFKEPVTFKNKSLPGDSVFFIDKTGKVAFHILTLLEIESSKRSDQFGN
jgi:hypothetical protein